MKNDYIFVVARIINLFTLHIIFFSSATEWKSIAINQSIDTVFYSQGHNNIPAYYYTVTRCTNNNSTYIIYHIILTNIISII